MEIRSPKDGFVVSVIAVDGSQVIPGQKILCFDTMDEDRQQQKIEKMEVMRQAHMAQYQGRALELSIQIMQYAIDIADQDVELKQKELERAELSTTIPVYNPQNWAPAALISNAHNNLTKVQRTADKARGDLEKFKLSIARALDMAAAVEQYFHFEKEQLAERREQLTVTTPVAGSLVLLCGVGSYAKHGNVIARIDS